MSEYFFDRDISWLAFNERVLQEAARQTVPIGERLKFLSIYSSNLDEFYRVRIPALMALVKLTKKTIQSKKNYPAVLDDIKRKVDIQQAAFGEILRENILPQLKEQGIHIIYNEPVPLPISEKITDYFFSRILGYLQPVDTVTGAGFFPENNKLYAITMLEAPGVQETYRLINIPTDHLPRFLSLTYENTQYIVFLEDIIRENIGRIFKNLEIKGFYSFKITRDAEFQLSDEYEEDLAEKIEKQIAKRDFGLATRFLYDAKMPDETVRILTRLFQLENVNFVKGGSYHNLKDFASLPLSHPSLFYDRWEPKQLVLPGTSDSLLESILSRDIMLHAPYHAYDPVLRFFNEAAVDEHVTEIFTTLYRVAQQSGIVHALISAAKNGKKVTVLVELKARFDEANNIRWAKKMKEAGITINYSPVSLKVHAKVALIKKNVNNETVLLGLFATGNLNEVTARFYTDHILFTAHKEMLIELEHLFTLLRSKKMPGERPGVFFRHLLVARFNLKTNFIRLIDNEIIQAKSGRPAGITIKLNNLEERELIEKLYEASQHGVKIRLIVRGICCLVPGVTGISKNISVRRIVDRYLEHGRVFVFHNEGRHLIYLGSADWMNRNIYHRIEVCFPVYDEKIRKEIITMINIQLDDNVQAVQLDDQLNNVPIVINEPLIRSQQTMHDMVTSGII